MMQVQWSSEEWEAEEAPDVIRVVLVDDHAVVRCRIADVVNAAPDLAVVGDAGGYQEAIERIPALRPDVAVVNTRLPDGDGVVLCRQLLFDMQGLRCLILTWYTDEQAVLDTVLAGASGYVMMDLHGLDLVDALRQVAAGRSLLHNRAAVSLIGAFRAQFDTGGGVVAALTRQDRAMLGLLVEGLTDRQIAHRIQVPEYAVRNDVSRVLTELGTEGRTRVAAGVSLPSSVPARPRRPPW